MIFDLCVKTGTMNPKNREKSKFRESSYNFITLTSSDIHLQDKFFFLLGFKTLRTGK